MNFENDLKELIKKEYKSIRAFSQYAKIPYSTIDNIFKRGISGVSIQVVLNICNLLNIDIEKISNDELVIKDTTLKNYTFSKDEKQLIINYRNLDNIDQAEIRGEIKHMLKADKYTNNLYKGKKSSYPTNDYEIAAWGADGTKGTYKAPEKEIT